MQKKLDDEFLFELRLKNGMNFCRQTDTYTEGVEAGSRVDGELDAADCIAPSCRVAAFSTDCEPDWAIEATVRRAGGHAHTVTRNDEPSYNEGRPASIPRRTSRDEICSIPWWSPMATMARESKRLDAIAGLPNRRPRSLQGLGLREIR